jgi:hypothetical protein
MYRRRFKKSRRPVRGRRRIFRRLRRARRPRGGYRM